MCEYSNCETTLHMRLNVSAILSADILIQQLADSPTKTEALALISEFYSTTKAYKSHIYDARITALSFAYSGMAYAVLQGISTDTKTLFQKLICFIVNSNRFDYINYQYTITITKIFHRAWLLYYLTTFPSLTEVNVRRIYSTMVDNINIRTCISEKFISDRK